MTKTILRDEFRVSVGRKRFRTADGWSWPITLVAIDDRDRLGYFNPQNYTIAIHKRLMYSAKDRVLKDILRHELAHYFTQIEYEAAEQSGRKNAYVDETAHGRLFRETCRKYALGPEVSRATMDLCDENEKIEGELASEAVISRIQRLLALAESDNEHEAALAVVRANELMVRHNLDSTSAPLQRGQRAGGVAEDEIEFCVRVVIPCKRSSPRISAISRILGEFLVCPVQGYAGLEVTGTRANVEHAEYIANYLNRELAAAWKRARQEDPDRRLREKPFMAAAAESYIEKLTRSKERLPRSDQRALLVLSEQLEWATNGAYGGGLHSTTSSYTACADSESKGAKAGASLSIRRGVSGSQTQFLLTESA